MKRNFGIDLLRMVSMFMVIILHVMVHGGTIFSVPQWSISYYIFWFLEVAAFPAVNCFALVSGYVGYGRRKKASSIITLSAQALFYIIVFTAAECFVKGGFDQKSVLASVLAFRDGGYWYFKSYLCAWFFFPCIDAAVEKLERKQLKNIVVAMFLMLSVSPFIFFSDIFSTGLGYSPFWLVVMYFYGAYVKKYGLEQNKKPWKFKLLFLFMTIITWAGVMLGCLYSSSPLWQEYFLSFSSPTVVLAAVFLFFAYANKKTNKFGRFFIKIFSPVTFGIYLVHTQFVVWNWFEGKFLWIGKFEPVYAALILLGVTAGIFVICSAVDYIRKLIFGITGISRLIKKADRRKRITEITSEKINEKENEYVDCR